ncbi:MAG TPA: hemolysin family protein [Solirubrobacteraceae bacterium]|nr:hemolysin family protein [Solirubrobacteraceae bacterium]
MTGFVLVVTALLVAVNGFFVLAEYSLVRARRSKLEALQDEGARGAALALEQIDHINEYISAVQIGVTMVSIGIGALGEPALARVFRGPLGDAFGHGVAVVVAGVISYAMITSALIVGGEIVPKLYAIGHAEGAIRRVARPLQLFRVTFAPFIVVLTAASNRILRLLGVDPSIRAEKGGSPDELKRLISDSYAGGHLDAEEAEMLTGVFHLHEQEARQVMTPIPAVVTVDTSEDVETALRRCVSSGHTRLVVTEDHNQDRVRGMVHVISLAKALMTQGPRAPIEPLVHDVPIVPETKPLDDLLAELQRQRTAMGVVIDEYGRVAGIVTIEDIVEEVVGEIADETDPAAGEVRRLSSGDWFVRGHVPVSDLVDYGIELPADSDAYNSVGGLVFATLGRLPKRGDAIDVDGYSIRVESVRENRIEAVRIRPRPERIQAGRDGGDSDGLGERGPVQGE